MNKPEVLYVTYVSTKPEELGDGLARAEFTQQCFFDPSVELEGHGGRAVDRTAKSFLSLTLIASSACPRVRGARSPLTARPLFAA